MAVLWLGQYPTVIEYQGHVGFRLKTGLASGVLPPAPVRRLSILLSIEAVPDPWKLQREVSWTVRGRSESLSVTRHNVHVEFPELFHR